MRGLRKVLIVAAVSFAGCAREHDETVAAPPTDMAPTTTASEAPAGSQPPAQSGLSIKRGIVMLAQDRATFRPCGEKVELWLLDQTDGMLTETFTQEAQSGPALLYMEAYGERAPVADDIPEARAYAGTLMLEQVLYAGVQGEIKGCDAPARNYVVAARGNEPFWAAEVNETQLIWRQPEAPAEIVFDVAETLDAEGAVRYQASAAGHQVELMIDAQPCRDSMSGEFFAFTARALLDGKAFSGCGRVGK